MPVSEDNFHAHAGALRYRNEEGFWNYANPGDSLYSTVTMVATQYWSEEKGWLPIYEEQDGLDALQDVPTVRGATGTHDTLPR